MECAVVIVENGCIVIYKSDDRLKLEKEVIRAKKSGFPYAVNHSALKCVSTFSKLRMMWDSIRLPASTSSRAFSASRIL